MKKLSFIVRVIYTILSINTACFFYCQGQSKKQNLYTLRGQDAEIIKSIFKFSMASLDTVTEEMHADFWKVIKRNGGNPNNIFEIGPKDITINFINETGTLYLKTFYEDALISVKTGKPFESVKRKDLNTKLDEVRLEKNESLMIKIANKEPIPYNNEEIVLNEVIINRIIKNLDIAINLYRFNLDILYTEKYGKK